MLHKQSSLYSVSIISTVLITVIMRIIISLPAILKLFIGISVGIVAVSVSQYYTVSSPIPCFPNDSHGAKPRVENNEYVEHRIPRVANEQEKTRVFIGVLTANKYLSTRAHSVYNTWAQSLSGKILFFTAENSTDRDDIPMVRLAGIDDSYPPQRKSFEMLKYMYEHYPHYDFYLRADDDLHIRPEKLDKFLSSIDPSEPLLIGQPGRGILEERPTLFIPKGVFYCMGGPGIIISNAALRHLFPHIQNCTSLTKTFHEDIELWRCVNHYVGISCTTSLELKEIFYHSHTPDETLCGEIRDYDIIKPITLHPLKNHLCHYKMYAVTQSLRIKELEYEMRRLMEEAQKTRMILNASPLQLSRVGEGIFLNYFDESDVSVRESHYDFLSKESLYSAASHFYRAEEEKAIRVAVQDMEKRLFISVKRSSFVSMAYFRHLKGAVVEYVLHINLFKNLKKGPTAKYKTVNQTINYIRVPFGSLHVRETRQFL